jgi:hypothetical protein
MEDDHVRHSQSKNRTSFLVEDPSPWRQCFVHSTEKTRVLERFASKAIDHLSIRQFTYTRPERDIQRKEWLMMRPMSRVP